MASSLSSILNQPQCALLRFRIQKRCCFSLRLLSSYPETSLDPRCARRSTTRQLKRSFSLNLSRNFSHSSLDLPDGPGLHHFIAQSSFTASQPLADYPTVQTRLVPIQDHLWNLRRRFPVDRLSLAPASEVSSATGSEVHSQARIYQETYGCQMNVNDMEIVLSIMKNAGYSEVINVPENAEVIFINTCAIRDYAEHKVWQRLNYFWFLKREWKKNVATGRSQSKHPPKIVVLGCMAERLKDKILDADKMVDVVCGPDAYRDLPRLLEEVDYGQKGINTLLSLEETYADISPVRISKNSVTAFVSVMRGCNNMCSFCIVPFTRGRERSRPLESIVKEVAELWKEGVKEVTLLGQNVNSYNDTSGMEKEVEPGANWRLSEGFNSMCKVKKMGLRFADLLPLVKEVEPGANWRLSEGFKNMCKVKKMGLRFADLLDRLSLEFPEMRFRYTSPHPKDFPDELLYIMRDRPNVCKYIHLPAQTGNSAVLERMRRGYTREAYLDLVQKIRQIIPDVGLSSDFICGFCGETEEEHADTLTLMKAVGYDMAYMFAYSMRERTHAHRNYVDDVPEEVKQRRLTELIEAF